MFNHPGTVPDPNVTTPQSFFGTTVAKILKMRRDSAKALGGTLLFDVVGKGGGCWFVDIGEARVFAGAPACVDCTVEMSTKTFDGLIKGAIDLEKAIVNHELEIRGNPAALQAFVRITDP